jgi:hypothetical protein
MPAFRLMGLSVAANNSYVLHALRLAFFHEVKLRHKPRTMTQRTAPTIDVVTLRADKYSPDGKSVFISLQTKHASEMTLSVPVACFHDLIADLRNLQPPGETAATTTSNHPAVASKPAEHLNRINVIVPKKWMLRSGLPNHPLIIMVFDPQTEAQAGYALTVAAAREMAVGLVKYADTVSKHEEVKRKPN